MSARLGLPCTTPFNPCQDRRKESSAPRAVRGEPHRLAGRTGVSHEYGCRNPLSRRDRQIGGNRGIFRIEPFRSLIPVVLSFPLAKSGGPARTSDHSMINFPRRAPEEFSAEQREIVRAHWEWAGRSALLWITVTFLIFGIVYFLLNYSGVDGSVRTQSLILLATITLINAVWRAAGALGARIEMILTRQRNHSP
jgi:hypothetical protein